MEIETWEQEKEKYKLREICPHVFVYAIKEEEKGAEPSHWICAACYNQGKKSILQLNRKEKAGHFYICYECCSEICDHSKRQPTKRRVLSRGINP